MQSQISNFSPTDFGVGILTLGSILLCAALLRILYEWAASYFRMSDRARAELNRYFLQPMACVAGLSIALAGLIYLSYPLLGALISQLGYFVRSTLEGIL